MNEKTMKLYNAAFSPFGRKVVLYASLLGVKNIVEEKIDIFNPPPGYGQINPLFKLPALQVNDHYVVFDSPLICEYLEEVCAERRILPLQGPARWHQLRLQALADGVLDAAILRRLEGIREKFRYDPKFDERQNQKIVHGLKELNEAISNFPTDWKKFGLGEIAALCVKGYLDLRLPHANYRQYAPRLWDLYDETTKQWDLFQKTEPRNFV